MLVLAIPLPEEPVGVGAKWRVATVLRQHPAIVKQVATYTLVARTAKRWKIAVDIERHGEEQVVFDRRCRPARSRPSSCSPVTLEGTLEVDPAQPLPTGTLTAKSMLHVRIAMPDSARPPTNLRRFQLGCLGQA